ncbi:MAG: hypothetical protein AAGB97_01760 [Dehalococcoidia bacterium]|nr:hypothetical protein [Chloroflexota bacterium]MBT9159476.1 hypothetical protein [Chloroflexota bacterium]MBT9161586.1 hypothetical protein [Chloroflexota bacterium]
MKQYEYAITVHKAGEILARVPDLLAEETPPLVYCDYQGKCFFDDAPSPYMTAIVEILNAQGEQGWVLAQIVLRQQDMICFWRRNR